VPGLLVQLEIFGAASVGFGLLAEMRAGVVERMRVTPTPRLALLLGRVARDILVLLVQATLLVCAALLFGLRVPLGDLVLGLLVVAALGAAFASASYAAALTLRAEDALASVLNGLAVPLLLLSGILLPMTLAPSWLRTVSDINPLKHVVDGVRALYVGHPGSPSAGRSSPWSRSSPPASGSAPARSNVNRASSGQFRPRRPVPIAPRRYAETGILGLR